MFILCSGAVCPEIYGTVGVMTRLGARATSLEVVSTLVLDTAPGAGG